MKNKFSGTFDKYACVGDTITASVKGFDIEARIEFDETAHIDDDDCHNIDQNVTGCNDKQQAELLAARQAWFNDQWFYCGIVLSVSKNGVKMEKYAAALWGIECNYPKGDNEYLTEVANELLSEAVKVGRDTLKRLVS